MSWLARQQNRDGGFSFATRGGESDVDDTGAALEALGRHGATTGRAVAYLRRRQTHDGGFPSQPGSDANAQSTAWAVQGLLAAGVSPASLHRAGAVSPLQFLRSLTAGDGHVRYAQGTDETPVWVTAQALMALEGKALPLAPVRSRGSSSARPARAAGASSPTAAEAQRRSAAPGVSPARAATGAQAATAGAAKHAVAPTPHRAGTTSATAPADDRALSGYAAGAGLLAALALAPVGLG